MPSFTEIFEDTSPYLTYSGNWRPGTSADDSSADKYSQSSFSVTQAANSSMSFVFYGTSIGIYGAKRAGHGPYQVQVDTTQYPPGNGNLTPDSFNQTLFSASLTKGFHTVTLTNSAPNFLDVDYVSWQTSVGEDNETLIVKTIDDSDNAFTYSSLSSWSTSPDMVGTFSGSSGHATSTPGSSAQLSFTLLGDAIALYGPSGPNCAALYSVRVDNKVAGNYSAFKASSYRPQQLLYYGANLGSGNHVLKIQLESTSGVNQALAIDFAQIYTTPSLGGSLNSNQTILVSNGLPTAVIVALALISTLAALSLITLVFLFTRHQKGRFRRSLRPPVEFSYPPASTAVQPTHVQSNSANGSFFSSDNLGPRYIIDQNIVREQVSESTANQGIMYPDLSITKHRYRGDTSQSLASALPAGAQQPALGSSSMSDGASSSAAALPRTPSTRLDVAPPAYR